METLKECLMRRDNMTSEEAHVEINEAIEEVYHGADPEEVLRNNFGLEPDFVMDLLGM